MILVRGVNCTVKVELYSLSIYNYNITHSSCYPSNEANNEVVHCAHMFYTLFFLFSLCCNSVPLRGYTLFYNPCYNN